MAFTTVTKPAGTAWEHYVKSVSDRTTADAIAMYIALWYPLHNTVDTIEIGEYVETVELSADSETEEEIQHWR